MDEANITHLIKVRRYNIAAYNLLKNLIGEKIHSTNKSQIASLTKNIEEELKARHKILLTTQKGTYKANEIAEEALDRTIEALMLDKPDEIIRTMPGKVKFKKEDIGAEILPILTRGIYRDTLDALREYIQNAIDARAARIDISIDPDVVSVTDDGTGMTEAEARKAIRLGISDKNVLVDVGFRGIGIYSSYNLCDSLELFTKSQREETTYRIYFDFKYIRLQLLAEQEQRSQGKPPQLYLERLLEESVFMEPATEGIINGHGTKVIMTGILPESYRRLNDWNQVVDYLQNVVPLPFSPQFKYGSVITEKFAEEGYKLLSLNLQMNNRTETLYRPYIDEIFKFGGKHEPMFFDIKDSKQTFGFAWVCVNDARETIKDLKVRGLLMKKLQFSIGDRRYLEPYFGRTVYSRRITGEVIIKHPNFIPNAARSDFENNSTFQAFLEVLPRFTRAVDNWANDIQENDRALDVLADVISELSSINLMLPKVQRDREELIRLNVELADIKRRLKYQEKRLKLIDRNRLEETQGLLKGAESFVHEALISQRKMRQTFEEEVAKTIQREALVPSEEERERKETIPDNLVTLLEVYDLLDSPELRSAVQFLDDNVLRANLDQDTYLQSIRELHDYLEERL